MTANMAAQADTPRIDLKPEHLAIVQAILCEHLPENARVWVFGSRATGRARRGSDLDLAIDTGQPLSAETELALRFAFEDSDLPWTVDVVDMQRLREGIFRQNVERDRLALAYRTSGKPRQGPYKQNLHKQIPHNTEEPNPHVV